MPSDWSTGSVSNRAYNRLNDVPTAVSGTVMTDYAEEALFFVNTYFDDSVTTTAIPDKYKTLLVDLTCAYTLSRMAQVGLDFDATIGEFSISKGNTNNYDKRVDFYTQRVNAGLDAAGSNKVRFYQTLY